LNEIHAKAPAYLARAVWFDGLVSRFGSFGAWVLQGLRLKPAEDKANGGFYREFFKDAKSSLAAP
jgi:hypothetical protein